MMPLLTENTLPSNESTGTDIDIDPLSVHLVRTSHIHTEFTSLSKLKSIIPSYADEIDRFHSSMDRRMALVSRILPIHVAGERIQKKENTLINSNDNRIIYDSDYQILKPLEIEIKRNGRHRKPFLSFKNYPEETSIAPNYRLPEYSISHHNDFTVMALCNQSVGIDIQGLPELNKLNYSQDINNSDINADNFILQFLEYVKDSLKETEMSVVQYLLYQNLSQYKRDTHIKDSVDLRLEAITTWNSAFLHIWTMKEAFLKCIGTGISSAVNMSNIECVFSPEIIMCCGSNKKGYRITDILYDGNTISHRYRCSHFRVDTEIIGCLCVDTELSGLNTFLENNNNNIGNLEGEEVILKELDIMDILNKIK